MIASHHEPDDQDMPPDDGASAHARGSFFGRRKGHKLRNHQADLIDNLLPHLALDIGGGPAPSNLAELFGRECGKRMVWEATDARKARTGEVMKQ